MSIVCGFGINIDAAFRALDDRWMLKSFDDFKPLENLIKMAPGFASDHTLATLKQIETEVVEAGDAVHIAHVASDLMFRMFGDDAGSTGLSYILSLVLAEAEDVIFEAMLDANCNELLFFKKKYPWEMNDKEKSLTEDDVRLMIGKYIGILTDKPADVVNFDSDIYDD